MSPAAGPHSPWDDDNVQEALKGRPPADIQLLSCERCGGYSYYNEGSHFTCAWCWWSAGGRRLERLLDDPGPISLEEYADPRANEGGLP